MTPPYVSYQAFDAFIAELAVKGIPDHCDESVFASFSGTLRAQLVSALRYLELLDQHRRATADLRSLVTAHGGGSYSAELTRILERSYKLPTAFNLETATPSHFADAFERLGCSPGVLRKAQVFYLKAARAAGYEIGMRLEYGRRLRPVTVPSEPAGPRRRASSSEILEALAIRRDMVRKYPAFNPDWSEGLQQAWIEGFRSLVPPA